MHVRFRWAAATLVAAFAASCGSSNQTKTTSTDTGPGSAGAFLNLPEVPAKVDAARMAPDAEHTPAARSPILDNMVAENRRWMDTLAGATDPAYYLAYYVYDTRRVAIEAEGGALVSSDDDVDRQLDVEVRVGSPELDNTRELSDDPNGLNQPLARRGTVPFSADPLAVSHSLWLETDRRYREAVQALGAVKQDASMLAEKQKVPDFVHEKPEIYIQRQAELELDRSQWEQRVKECSKRAFRGVATRATCRVDFEVNTVYMVNSEGTQLQRSWPSSMLSISVGVKADDGMQLHRLEQRFGRQPGDLPSGAELDTMIAEVTTDLDALHEAPVVDPYVGPAILEGRAAAVFFHEVFGHRIEGHRQTADTSGQTFSTKVGERIMPPWLSVYDDPTITKLNGEQLNGFYHFDDEGVRAQRAMLVEDGVLRGFVQGRDPVEGFPHSNGHGRKQPGLFSVSRQGNLVVEASRSVPEEELEKLLIDEIKRQKKPFGMIFSDISGGFTLTSRFTPQSFKVNPVMAYRLYPDGRRELVRGVDIVGTPLIALGSIMAASRDVETFNGMCGAESGWVPVSASAPSLLIEKLEIERGFKEADRPPILPSPAITEGTN